MDYRMQAEDSADTANRRKTYIKQSGRGMRKSPKRFCLLTFVLIGDAPFIIAMIVKKKSHYHPIGMV